MTSGDCRSHGTLGYNRIKRLDPCEINEEVVSFKILRFEDKWLRTSLRTGCKKGFIMSRSGPRTEPCGTPQMTVSHRAKGRGGVHMNEPYVTKPSHHIHPTKHNIKEKKHFADGFKVA